MRRLVFALTLTLAPTAHASWGDSLDALFGPAVGAEEERGDGE